MDPTEIESHPLLDLIDKPNPMQGQASFFESVIAYYLISGNSYLEAVGPSESAPPLELWSLRPDKIKIVPGPNGLPQGYEFKSQSKTIFYPVDQLSGNSQILHLKTFHPTNNWYGLSSIESAIYSIDQHNESGKWNTSLLQNMATPSGVITIKENGANPLGLAPETQFENFKSQMRQKLEGANNAGRTLLLEGGMDWKQMGLSPKEMDWIEGRKMAARDIALAFGVPPIILNIPGDSTFANYKEARVSLYEDTILPLMDNLQDELNKWLVPRFGENLELKYDIDSISALDAKRSEKFTLVSGAGFLTINEKRLAVGYAPVDDGDVILLPSGQTTLESIVDAADLADVTTDLTDQPDPELELSPNDSADSSNTENNDTNSSEDPNNNVNEDIEKSFHTLNLIEQKQINPLTKGDRIRIGRILNRKRDTLADALFNDLKDDFAKMNQDIGNISTNLDAKLAEYAVLRVISESSKDFKATLTKHYKRALRTFGEPVLESGKSLTPKDMDKKSRSQFNDYIDRATSKHVAEAIGLIENTNIKTARVKIKKIVADSIENGESTPTISTLLQKEFETLSTSRATLIARTEITTASNAGAVEAAKALEVPDLKKEWIAIQDDRTRDGVSSGEADHYNMNGVRVGMDEKFIVQIEGYSPAEMDQPGDQAGGPENVCNCRCFVTFSRG